MSVLPRPDKVALMPWLVANIPDLQPSIFGPLLLLSLSKWPAVLFCTDDTIVVVSKSHLSFEAVIEKSLKYRDCQFLPSDLKGVDVMPEGSGAALSSLAYLDTKEEAQQNYISATKLCLHRELTYDEENEHRTASDRPAWNESEISYPSTFIAGMTLQDKKESFASLNYCLEPDAKVWKEKLVPLQYLPLEFPSIHIQLLSNDSF